MTDLLRVYTEAGSDGYPPEWHRCPVCNGEGWIYFDPAKSSGDGCPSCTPPGGCGGAGSIKQLVRVLAGHRCVRCLHPYECGLDRDDRGEWSTCDERCTHGGPLQIGGRLFPTVQKTGGSYARSYPRQVAARWRILTVHHLTGDKLDCRWWNLAALCQRCHLQIQGRVNMAQVWPYPHTPWFRPYAAGYYAASYLGEDLTREETIERMDELLALEAAA